MISRRSILHRALTAAAAGTFVGVCRWLPVPRKAEVEGVHDRRVKVVYLDKNGDAKEMMFGPVWITDSVVFEGEIKSLSVVDG